ncbi:MAG: DUF4349 domain-containing protein [Polyangiaceae bacterium]
MPNCHREDTRITMRVPAGKFDGLSTKWGNSEDLHRNVNVQDVTAEYTDLAIRQRKPGRDAGAPRGPLEEGRQSRRSPAGRARARRVAGELERIEEVG